MKKLSMFMVAVFTLVALTGSAFAWPGYLEGKPDGMRARDARGYFIWNDNQGIHLFTAAQGREQVYSGVIRTDGKFVNVDDFRTEAGDHIRVSRERDTIWFKFTTGKGLDGLNFNIRGGERVQFDLNMDGRQVSRQMIFLGNNGKHPRDNNFTLRR